MERASFIAVDGSLDNLPADVAEMAPPRAAIAIGSERIAEVDHGTLQGQPLTVSASEKWNGSVLDRWDVQSHQYSTESQVKASLLAKLLSGGGEVSHYGIVQEAKRYCIQSSKQGRNVEFGTAVRLSVALLSTKFETSLTLPNIAATAQLSSARARISLSVDGYAGSLGELLPAPDDLNVENLASYLAAFRDIQKEVFGKEGTQFIVPTLLGYVETSAPEPAKKEKS